MPQVGRRPSPPGLLFAIAAMWILCGVAAWIGLTAMWKWVIVLVFMGVGGFFLRGALQTVVRHEERAGDVD